MLERYLQDLDRELSQRLPEKSVQALLAETECHLRSEVETLRALGLPEETAERQAIRSFGTAEAVAGAT